MDDHRLFREGFTLLVNMLTGYKVLFTAADGLDFIKKLDPGMLPSIVLVDIAMPGMNGCETVAWIRQHHPSIRVLALSTMDKEQDIREMIAHGAHGYVLKDADPSELTNSFDRLLRESLN